MYAYIVVVFVSMPSLLLLDLSQIWTHEKQNVAFVAIAALAFAIKAVGSSDNSGPDGSGRCRGRIMKCDG